MLITVTNEHIESSKCKDANHCMIATAIKDMDKGARYVSVRTNGITVTSWRKNGSRVRSHYAVPLKAARAIIKFDNGEPVKPFSFEPKLIDRKVFPALTPEQTAKYKKAQRVKRARWKAAGQTEPKYGRAQRIAGV